MENKQKRLSDLWEEAITQEAVINAGIDIHGFKTDDISVVLLNVPADRLDRTARRRIAKYLRAAGFVSCVDKDISRRSVRVWRLRSMSIADMPVC